MISFIQIQAKQSEAIRPVQTAVKLKCTYSYSLHHAASRSSTPPGQATGYNRKVLIDFETNSSLTSLLTIQAGSPVHAWSQQSH